MAKIVIAGEAVVVTSKMKLADLRKIAKYRPNVLILKGGEDGKEPIFRVGVTNGAGTINKYGVEFANETHDEEKLATITLILNDIEGDVREAVAEEIGTAILNLNEIEEKLPYVLEEIEDEKESILSSITVAQ